jgi:epoxyqueuosine reductase QueG
MDLTRETTPGPGRPTTLDDLRAELAAYVRESPRNRFPDSADPYFEEPVVGVAAADDPIFHLYKQVVGPFHSHPRELLPSAVSVVSWVLPIARPTKRSNRPQDALPSRSWAQTRSFGEPFNDDLRRHLQEWLVARGHAAVAPVVAPGWHRVEEGPMGIASTWSERHAAYAAGLGTFSLNDGLITIRGIAHRLGSVVTALSLPPTSEGRPGVREHCTFYGDGSCTACIERCPAGAITPAGHDKERCHVYLETVTKATLAGPWGTPIPGCGLCQTKVPCEDRIPPRAVKKGSASRT